MGYQGENGYTTVEEPDQEMLGWAWSTAIGLQAVDDLQPSDYLVDLAMQSVEGELSLRECSERIERHYAYRARLREEEMRTEEADRVSARIAALLCEPVHAMTPSVMVDIHKRLFAGIDENAGRYRTANVTRAEEILDGASVTYADASGLADVLDDVLAREARRSYAGLAPEDVLLHLSRFAAALFQTHPFDRGNARTIVVFLLRYLRSLGYQEMADTFAESAVYFRGALVAAVYQNLPGGVTATPVYLQRFLGNLLLGQENMLDEEDLLLANREPVAPVMMEEPAQAAPVRLTRVNLVGPQRMPAGNAGKVDIDTTSKVDIGVKSGERRRTARPAGPDHPDPEKVAAARAGAKAGGAASKAAGGASKATGATSKVAGTTTGEFSAKTERHIAALREQFGDDGIWGRGDVTSLLGIRGSGASKMIGNLLDAGIIEPVSGYGKGRYHFVQK